MSLLLQGSQELVLQEVKQGLLMMLSSGPLSQAVNSPMTHLRKVIWAAIALTGTKQVCCACCYVWDGHTYHIFSHSHISPVCIVAGVFYVMW